MTTEYTPHTSAAPTPSSTPRGSSASSLTPASEESAMPAMAHKKPKKNQRLSLSRSTTAAASAVNSGADATITPTSEAEI